MCLIFISIYINKAQKTKYNECDLFWFLYQSDVFPPAIIALCPFGGKLFSFVDAPLLLFTARKLWIF